MRIIDIVAGTTVDGPGLRTSVYMAGCLHNCPGCHNPQTHDPAGGIEMSVDEVIAVIEENGFDVTLTGGDPLFQPEATAELARRLKEKGYGVWCYTGYLYEQAVSDPRLAKAIDHIDVLVDGPFRLEERDTTLRFRGSRNQRLVDLRRSSPGEVSLYEDGY